MKFLNVTCPQHYHRKMELQSEGGLFCHTIWISAVLVKALRPTYRLLGYCLAVRRFPVPNDLAGVGRPDLVDALLLEIYG
jgi:hypothetical protein